MKIIFLCKRRPQGKDLIDRPYGRFYYLPEILARKGHNVQVLLLSHKNEPRLVLQKDGILWTSVSLVGQGSLAYIDEAKKIIETTKPDWVVGFSDTYYGILAQYLANRYGCKSLIDAYDNYESYIPWLKPLHYLWRRALARADMVTAAGPQLAEMMQRDRTGRPAIILPMAADPEFIPLDRSASRKELDLPQEKKLIGYCGAIYRSRGIEFLYQLADRISTTVPGAEVVVSGRKEKGLTIPANIRNLGYLPDCQMPVLLNSMDVLLVLNRESSFGQYSYPVKLYEAMQCRIPVVSSETAPARWVLGGDSRFLGKVGDLEDFSTKVIAALDLGKPVYPSQPSWENVAGELEKILAGGA
jgi:glycosyltransferase involved in cell wall biosynthesis